ncbi:MULTISPECIES: DUF3089 domain-containing protein [unclassified Sphingomonas]|nr:MULTISPECIES: DUF3089 domain-containing protein [unclassified Sphingomonas]
MRRRGVWKKAALLAFMGTGALGLLGVFGIGPAATLVAIFESPSGPFDPARAPPAPDYAHSDAWLAFPGHNGLERSTPPGMTAIDEAKAPADVFFIHPTTYQRSNVWNVAYDHASEFDPAVLLGQASVFNGCCRIFAPHYRQASLRALDRSRDAVALAYGDVAQAFRHFIEHENRGRPFLIAAHSQGAMHAVRLLQAEILGTPLQSRLVAAYVIGAYAPSDFGTIGLPVCDGARQVGCILSWNTSQSGRTGAFQLIRDKTYWWRGGEKNTGQPPAICVNPLTWRREGAAPATDNPGSLPFPTGKASEPGRTLAALTPHLTGAVCDEGLLKVDIAWSAPSGFRDSLSLIYGSYHLGDYGIFYAAIRRNARERVQAWTAEASERGSGGPRSPEQAIPIMN